MKVSFANRQAELTRNLGRVDPFVPVCTENLIRVDDVMESPKLLEQMKGIVGPG
jgi:hypothetical protein